MENYDESVGQRVNSRTVLFRKNKEEAFAFSAAHRVPFAEIKAKVKGADANQLAEFEDANPWFLEQTTKMWKKHCAKRFPKLSRDEGESWRDIYHRGVAEEEKKLKKVSSRISKAAVKEQQAVRTTKCIDLPLKHRASASTTSRASSGSAAEAGPSRSSGPPKGHLMKRAMDLMKKRR
ncbi:hypothetical protein QR680_011300 [Steinernema hermaphroditum]|uniref:Uncharacterized protein n=1 Tax=Steinernema hermaphroditum TaxID=289476 RepID=A0AA39IT83_9BILA|nr:hypothetical protein QR680_011300 [Steinernema hermaphroditum]